MSRPKLPPISWRQMRIASAASLATLMTTALMTQPAHPERDQPPEPPARTAVALIDQTHTAHHDTARTLTAQAGAQSAAHREAAAKAAKAAKQRAERAQAAAEAARRKATAPARASRDTPRAQAATGSSARAYARSRLSPAQYRCLSNVVTRESSWNHRATNPTSGAYGLFQALPASKMNSAGSDWRTNPLTQIRWGISYMKARYGTPCGAWNFWQKNRWY